MTCYQLYCLPYCLEPKHSLHVLLLMGCQQQPVWPSCLNRNNSIDNIITATTTMIRLVVQHKHAAAAEAHAADFRVLD